MPGARPDVAYKADRARRQRSAEMRDMAGHDLGCPTTAIAFWLITGALRCFLPAHEFGSAVYGIGKRNAATIGVPTQRVVMIAFACAERWRWVRRVCSPASRQGRGNDGATPICCRRIAAVVLGGTAIIGGAELLAPSPGHSLPCCSRSMSVRAACRVDARSYGIIIVVMLLWYGRETESMRVDG